MYPMIKGKARCTLSLPEYNDDAANGATQSAILAESEGYYRVPQKKKKTKHKIGLFLCVLEFAAVLSSGMFCHSYYRVCGRPRR